MVCEIARRFVDWQLKKGSIPEDETEVFQYGYELFFSLFFNCVIAIVIAICFTSYLEVIVYYVAYGVLRSLAGGYHARDYEKCMVVSALVLICACLVIKVIPAGLYGWLGAINLVLAVPVIWVLVPVEDLNKPLDELEIKVFGRRARCILVAETIFAILCFPIGIQKVGFVVSLSMLMLSITLIMGLCKNRRLKKISQNVQ